MSLQSWKSEFYPVPADAVPEDLALAHSLKKWIGLRPENLKRHDVEFTGTRVHQPGIPDEQLYIEGSSCALCHYHLHPELPRWDGRCRSCPLYAVRGVPCDEPTVSNPWGDRINSVEPMIQLLERASRKP